jgi:molecular chaperone IbpA
MTRITTLNIPQIQRTAVGFDRLFSELERQFANSTSNGTGYPPYNVVQINQDEYMISLAVAGFRMEDLDITLDKNVLTVEGTSTATDDSVTYLHKGIAGRDFRRTFTLADHIEVETATLEYGMLNIHLVRNVPEALQPKKISIKMLDAPALTVDSK